MSPEPSGPAESTGSTRVPPSETLRIALHVGQLRQPVPGGIARYLRGLLTALPDEGIDVVPFAAGPVDRTTLAGSTIVHHVETRDSIDLGWPRDAVRYELWHRVHRPSLPFGARRSAPTTVDVVHAPSLAVPPTRGTPLVVTVHDLAWRRHPQAFTRRGIAFHERGLTLARRFADCFVVPSNFTRHELIEDGFDAERIVVAHHGAPVVPAVIEPEASERRRRLGLHRPFVLTVGTVEPRKRLDLAAQAIELLRRNERAADVELVVVGPPGWGEVNGLEAPWIRRLGPVDDDDLRACYHGATAVMVASDYEGFGLPALEAMAHGCPVIVSGAESLHEVVEAAGVIAPNERTSAGDIPRVFAAAVLRLLDDPALRADRQAAGRARARTFRWSDSARRHREAYELAIAQSSDRSSDRRSTGPRSTDRSSGPRSNGPRSSGRPDS